MLSNRIVVASLNLVFAAVLACEGVPGASGAQPTTPWNQQIATQLAGQLRSQLASLYTTAEKEPEFAGERSAYGKTLDNLRILREESGELHAQLQDGKSYDQTVRTYERIKEVARDTQESESWEFLPTDFTSQAKTAFSALDKLDAYFGAR